MKPAHLIIPTAALGAALLAAGCGGEIEASPASRAQDAKAELPAGRIAFRRYLDDAQTQGAVFTVKPDGTGEKQITHPPAGFVDDQPDWSPDGRTIAFERCSEEAPCSVWTVDASGGEPAKVHVRCTLEPVCDASGPVWTPDGRLVVDLAQGRERQHGDLNQIERFSLELLGKRGSQRAIVARDHWTGDAKESTVSSDGRTLVYMAWNSWKTKPANGTALYAIRMDGSHNRRLTPWKLGAGDHPAFSPDGRTVFFRSFAHDDSQQADYYTVDVKTRRTTRLSHFKEGTAVLSGSFSPDGKWIVNATDGVDGQADVFVMRADGSGNRPVTRSKAWDSAPDWGPPGS
jgi:Tol biopolymer transport system component